MPSFESVYRAEFTPVFRLLARMGVAPSTVEDLVHDVFLTAHRKWAEYDVSRPVRPWLFGIAYRLASDHRALKRHRHEVQDDTAAGSVEEVPRATTERLDAARLLDRALGRMSDDARTVFVLHDLEERTVPEIAELMGAGVPTTYTRLRSARLTLAAVVSENTEVRS